MLILNKDLIIKYLITLLPVTLVLSIFFTELILLIIMIFFFIDFFEEKKKYKNFFYIFLFLYVLYISISSVFGQDQIFKSTFFYFRFLLYFFALVYYFRKIKIYNSLLKSFILTVSILIIDGIIQFVLGFNILGMPTVHLSRISSFFGEELILGSYLVRLLPFFLIFFIYQFKNYKIIQLIFLFLFLFLEILSGEITDVFLLFLSFFIFFIFLKELRKLIMFL